MGKPSTEFARVARGDSVVVDGPYGLAMAGIVDEVAPDGTVLWIREDGGHSRRMIHVTDGAQVRRRGDDERPVQDLRGA